MGTQMSSARRGIATEEMRKVAKDEEMELQRQILRKLHELLNFGAPKVQEQLKVQELKATDLSTEISVDCLLVIHR